MTERKRYYFPFSPKAKVNYLFLLRLADIAEYNQLSGNYDTVRYKCVNDLVVRLNQSNVPETEYFSNSTVYRYLLDKNGAYQKYFSYNSKSKEIFLYTDFQDSKEPFVVLTRKEVDCLRRQDALTANERNLLIRYFCYLKYYIGYSRKKEIDTTAEQILDAFGYSTKANNYISLLASFNQILLDAKLIKIEKYRDSRGFFRNTYRL